MIRLTAKEEEILGYFWAKGPLFVRELLDLGRAQTALQYPFDYCPYFGGERIYRFQGLWKYPSVLCFGLGRRIQEKDTEAGGR